MLMSFYFREVCSAVGRQLGGELYRSQFTPAGPPGTFFLARVSHAEIISSLYLLENVPVECLHLFVFAAGVMPSYGGWVYRYDRIAAENTKSVLMPQQRWQSRFGRARGWEGCHS